jgi:hypothetical protein
MMALNARTKKKASEYVLFDVTYEDGSRTSNRKVPADELTGSDRDGAAKAFIESQDRKIAEASGLPRGAIKSILRVGR